MRLPGVIAVLIVLAAAASAGACGPALSHAPNAAVDRLFAEWDRSDSPGCSLGVTERGKVIYERSYGMADVERRVPIAPSTVFHVASISKQFTAMSILLLAQRGQLSLDEDVGKYIAGWMAPGQGPTIRQLLTHTGGLRDTFLLREIAAPSTSSKDMNREVVTTLARQRGFNFAPGSEFQYSNSGYAVLADIVKRVSGESLRSFAGSNIFVPLGMSRSHIHDDPEMVVADRAMGYRRVEGRWQVAVHQGLGTLVGTTGLFTTPADLLRWEQNFVDARVANSALLTAMQTPFTLTTGARTEYGFGLFIRRDHDLRTVGHGGNDPGVSAEVVRYPERDLAIAVLCNAESVASDLTHKVAGVYLGRGEEPPPVAPSPISLSAEQLETEAGLYRDVTRNSFGRIFVRDGKLAGSTNPFTDGRTFQFTAVGEHRFVIPGTSVVAEFIPARAGRAQELHVTGDGPPLVVFQQVTPVVPRASQLNELAGTYDCPDLATTFHISVRSSGLVLETPGRSAIPLRPVVKDVFYGSLVEVVNVLRDTGGAVVGLSSTSDGVKGLRLERVSR